MYNSYFGFSVSPFSVTPDPNFFYTNPVYQEAYANLRYGIESKKGFIVITGEVGTGKTTLLRKLMHNLEGTIHTVFVFNTYLDFTELLRVILYDLGLAPEEPNKVTMLQELNDYLIAQLKQVHIVSVLVDEAQNLNDEALEGLRLLSNLETDQEKLVQTVLMGQPELQARLDRPSLRQLKQRVALQCRLVPLKDNEVSSYVDFRLRAAGYKGKDLFHPDAFQQIAFYSNGIPRLVNIICDNALLCAYAQYRKIVSPDMIKEVARDLRLGSEAQLAQAETTPSFVAKTEPQTPIREAANDVPQHKVRRIIRVGVETCLTLLVLVAVASLIDPHNFLSNAGKGLEVAKHNLNQWLLFIIHQEAVPEKTSLAELQVLRAAESGGPANRANVDSARARLDSAKAKQEEIQQKKLETREAKSAGRLDVNGWRLSSGGCRKGPIGVSGTARFSVEPRGNDVLVSEEFQGDGNGYEVALSSSATFPRLPPSASPNQRYYDLNTRVEWKRDGKAEFSTKGIDRVYVDENGSPARASLIKISTDCGRS